LHWDNAIHQLQPKPRIEVAAVMFSAACETSNRAADAAHAREFLAAIRATINKTDHVSFGREWKIVTTGFVADFQIATRRTPFRTVRSNSSSSDAKLREQMRQLVSERTIDLVVPVI
jgi:hypothetical protein